jgi:hypothetical protein
MLTLAPLSAEVELIVCILLFEFIVPRCALNLKDESSCSAALLFPDSFRMITGSDLPELNGNSKNTNTTPINAIATAEPRLIETFRELSLCPLALNFQKDNKKPKKKYTRVSNGFRKTNVNNQRPFVPHRRPNIG